MAELKRHMDVLERVSEGAVRLPHLPSQKNQSQSFSIIPMPIRSMRSL